MKGREISAFEAFKALAVNWRQIGEIDTRLVLREEPCVVFGRKAEQAPDF